METTAAITRTTYGSLLSKYAIASTDELQPPDPGTAIQVGFSQNVAEPDSNKTMAFSSNEFKTAEIPKGYKAVRMEFDVRANSGHPKGTDGKDEVAISVHVGDVVLLDQRLNEFYAAEHGQSLPLNMATWSASGTRPMNGEEGVITVALAGSAAWPSGQRHGQHHLRVEDRGLREVADDDLQRDHGRLPPPTRRLQRTATTEISSSRSRAATRSSTARSSATKSSATSSRYCCATTSTASAR